MIVIGAGPAGLATAYYLKQRGLEFQVLEQDEVGSSWAQFYDAMHVHSHKRLSALPGLAMPANYPAFPSGKQMLAYFRNYAAHFSLAIQTQTRVLNATYEDTWQLQTSQGSHRTKTLIVATGIFHQAHSPRFAGQETFSGTVRHSRDYQNAKAFQGQRVLVVGAGNSAADIVVELVAEGIETGLVLRSGILMLPYPTLPLRDRLVYWLLRHLPAAMVNPVLAVRQRGFPEYGLPLPDRPPLERYPVIGFDLLEAAKSAKVSIHPAIVALSEDTVKFVDGKEAQYDSIILATGFQPKLDFIQPAPALNTQGQLLTPYPPGLHVIGFYYPNSEPFLLAIKREAKRLVANLQL